MRKTLQIIIIMMLSQDTEYVALCPDAIVLHALCNVYSFGTISELKTEMKLSALSIACTASMQTSCVVLETCAV